MLSEVPGLLPATATLHLTPQAVKSINRCSVKWPWMNAYSSNNSFLKRRLHSTVQTRKPSEPGSGNPGPWANAARGADLLSPALLHPSIRDIPAAPLFRPRAPLTGPQPGEPGGHRSSTSSRGKQGGDPWSRQHWGVPTGRGAVLPDHKPTSVKSSWTPKMVKASSLSCSSKTGKPNKNA